MNVKHGYSTELAPIALCWRWRLDLMAANPQQQSKTSQQSQTTPSLSTTS